MFCIIWTAWADDSSLKSPGDHSECFTWTTCSNTTEQTCSWELSHRFHCFDSRVIKNPLYVWKTKQASQEWSENTDDFTLTSRTARYWIQMKTLCTSSGLIWTTFWLFCPPSVPQGSVLGPNPFKWFAIFAFWVSKVALDVSWMWLRENTLLENQKTKVAKN